MDQTVVHFEDFNRIIGIILNNWTGLKLALDYGNGGTPMESRKKVEQLVTAVRTSLEKNSDSYEIADELETALDEQFNTIIEDGSNDEVAGELCSLFALWQTQCFDGISARMSVLKVTESILDLPTRQMPKEVHRASPGTSNEEDSPMEDDSEWTLVGKKKR